MLTNKHIKTNKFTLWGLCPLRGVKQQLIKVTHAHDSYAIEGIFHHATKTDKLIQ